MAEPGLPRDDVVREVIRQGRRVEPAPIHDAEVGEVRLDGAGREYKRCFGVMIE